MTTCTHVNHDEHMCMLLAKKTDVEALKPIVRDAKFICKNCGRAAAEAERLCAPVAL